jgi:hypothetical protein
MSQRFLRCVSAVVVVACVAGFGCDSMNNDKDKDAQKRERRAAKQEQRAREREQASRSDGPDQVIGRRDTARDRTTAGRSRGLDEVPTTATRVDEGDAARPTYSPTRDGTVYVYDADDDRVIFSTRVRRDERFVLDPDANRATIDGRTVLGTGLSARHRYRIYFDRGVAN